MATFLRLLLLIVLAVLVPAGAARGEESSSFARTVLDNGLTVITREVPGSLTVSLNIFVRAGSMYESDGTSGISHFYEHLFFRGTPARTGARMKTEIEQLGGVFNAETSRDMIHFHINLPSPYAAQGLDILADALMNADFKAEEIDKERAVVLDELRLTEASSGERIAERLFSLAFPHHPYGRPIIGTEENLKRFSPEDFRRYKQTWYVPSNCIVVVAGGFSRDEMMKEIGSAFAAFTGPAAALPAFDVMEPLCGISEEAVDTGESTSAVALAYVAPSVGDRPDVYAMDVLAYMLGVGRESILGRELVAKRGLALGAEMEFLTQRCRGLAIISATVAGDDAIATKHAMLEILEDVCRGRFSASDVERAKTLIVTSADYATQSNYGLAENLGFYETIDSVRFAETYAECIGKVTADDLAAVASKYLGKGHVGFVIRPRGKTR